jgi:hypothetical protein
MHRSHITRASPAQRLRIDRASLAHRFASAGLRRSRSLARPIVDATNHPEQRRVRVIDARDDDRARARSACS